MSILDLPLDFKLVDKKYYIKLSGKILKSQNANEIYCDSLKIVNKLQEDYKQNRFKSKWINLIASYVDFVNDSKLIDLNKQQLKSYFTTDLLFYVDKNDLCYNNYVKAIELFKQTFQISEKLTPVADFAKTDISQELYSKVDEIIEELTDKELFIASFLTKISTSFMLTMLYIYGKINIYDFFNNAFLAEISKQEQSPDNELNLKLKSLKHELEILDYYRYS